MGNNTKPKLIPLRVPWMVSASTPFLRLVALESASQECTHVEFVAYNRCEDTSPPVAGTSVQVLQPPSRFRAGGPLERGPYRLIRIAFKLSIAARLYPAYSDTQDVDESLFDWSHVAGRRTAEEDLFEYQRRVLDLWLQTGVCPDPRAYEVVKSPWLEEMQLDGDQRWKHYLILGHDAFAEVIAEGHEIIESQVLGGW